ncbi:prefoldin subunit, putative [Entamoeba invadens IP1]|uniref:Prefoldin subunit, putative n=1 Tax=Entamoeba invadens IP1 TaxID=370355 RepID=L7FML2_ENTIV|nr:prefoldin subunit, putative [Entamoeba invadens IP1]ELP91582.1 prefoldin subunit, putative [Entamoeba invadens IP1]|eukprot:XP_004258353.1 prefoldin subunit, putative [Entamoeba invadens IP1]
MNPQQVVLTQLQQLKQDQNLLARQLADMDSTLKEHRVVLDVLAKVEPTRKCFRLVNGVMVERTASEIIPAVNKSIEQINQVMEQLNESIKSKTAEINKFMEHYKIQQKDQPIIAQP